MTNIGKQRQSFETSETYWDLAMISRMLNPGSSLIASRYMDPLPARRHCLCEKFAFVVTA